MRDRISSREKKISREGARQGETGVGVMNERRFEDPSSGRFDFTLFVFRRRRESRRDGACASRPGARARPNRDLRRHPKSNPHEHHTSVVSTVRPRRGDGACAGHEGASGASGAISARASCTFDRSPRRHRRLQRRRRRQHHQHFLRARHGRVHELPPEQRSMVRRQAEHHRDILTPAPCARERHAGIKSRSSAREYETRVHRRPPRARWYPP